MSLSPDQKKAEVLKLRDEGLRPYEIADRLGIEDSTVRTWLSRAPKTGTSCVKCDESLNNSPDAFCGWCREMLVADLLRSPDDRALAIRTLRGAGYSASSIAAAVSQAAHRKPASEVLEVLLQGGAERVGAVA